MLQENDRIAIGLSGGKDSMVLFHVLNKIEARFPHSDIFTITIDEGIKGYRDESLEIVKGVVKQHDIEHYHYSFKDLCGHTLDELVQITTEKQLQILPCTICGVMRRRALNFVAREHGASKLAIGHNLDDEAQTVLMNVLRADLERLYRLDPIPSLKHPDLVPRIKPLREIPEKETSLYLYYQNLPFHSVECPYTPQALRRQIQTILNDLEAKNPNIKFSLLRFFDKLHPILQEHPPITKTFKSCSRCGEVTNTSICKYCVLIDQLLNKK